MSSQPTPLLVSAAVFLALVVASGPTGRVEAAPDQVWTDNWRADDGQQIDTYEVVDVSGMIAIPPQVVARLCGDFDGCAIRVIDRYFSGDTACPGGVHESSARLFTDESAGWWVADLGSTSLEGRHGNLVPERILYVQSTTQPDTYFWSFQDDYIPPGTFDLSYGFECHDSVVIQCYFSRVCGLVIED
jgi:hypothetical protein